MAAAGLGRGAAMLLRLAAEFDLQRDVVPWLAAQGWAAALGNAALAGAGQRRAEPALSFPPFHRF